MDPQSHLEAEPRCMLGRRFNEDILHYRAEWHPMQYDTDQHLHRRLMASRVRTRDPTTAKLFLLPVYVGRYYDYYWQKWSPDGQPWAVPGPSGGWEKWEWAMGNTSQLVQEAILHVRQNFPYWNRSTGADHFMVFAYDKGRCEQVQGSTPSKPLCSSLCLFLTAITLFPPTSLCQA